MKKSRIILDCDPGHDDAVAIMMAAIHPTIDLLGITTVAGNQILRKTSVNALKVCQYLELNVDVYAGMDRPLVREQVIAEDIHGESGLDGPIFPPLHRSVREMHAVDYIIETLQQSAGDIVLVATGPLTNLAMAFRRNPTAAAKVQQIVLMGGAYQLGNVTPAAEFNIFADAEAAHVVFTSNIPITMMGLDLTRQALCYPNIIERMETCNNPGSRLFGDLMRFFCKTQKAVFGWEGGPLHDPTCIAYLIDPGCIEVTPMHTEVEIRSEKCYGRTLCDSFNTQGKNATTLTQVATTLDKERFWHIVEECIALYGEGR